MIGREFGPGRPGRGVPGPRVRGRRPVKEEPRRAGPPERLEGNIDKAIDKSNDIEKSRQGQPYPIRLLKQRHGLSTSYAAFVAAELFRWGGV